MLLETRADASYIAATASRSLWAAAAKLKVTNNTVASANILRDCFIARFSLALAGDSLGTLLSSCANCGPAIKKPGFKWCRLPQRENFSRQLSKISYPQSC